MESGEASRMRNAHQTSAQPGPGAMPSTVPSPLVVTHPEQPPFLDHRMSGLSGEFPR